MALTKGRQGRPRAVTEDEAWEMLRLKNAKEPVKNIIRRFNICRATFYNTIKEIARSPHETTGPDAGDV